MEPESSPETKIHPIQLANAFFWTALCFQVLRRSILSPPDLWCWYKYKL